MKVPNPATFTVRSVLRYCGAQLEVCKSYVYWAVTVFFLFYVLLLSEFCNLPKDL